MRAASTWKNSPRKSTSSPVCSLRMISMASASMSWRSATAGHPMPTTCSLRFSPDPSPQREAAVGEDLQGRGLLRHDGRVVADRRAGHVGHQLDAFGRVGRRAQDRPRVRGRGPARTATGSSGRWKPRSRIRRPRRRRRSGPGPWGRPARSSRCTRIGLSSSTPLRVAHGRDRSLRCSHRAVRVNGPIGGAFTRPGRKVLMSEANESVDPGGGGGSVDTVLLDVDGTLIDSTYLHALAWMRAFTAHDLTPAVVAGAPRHRDGRRPARRRDLR